MEGETQSPFLAQGGSSSGKPEQRGLQGLTRQSTGASPGCPRCPQSKQIKFTTKRKI